MGLMGSGLVQLAALGRVTIVNGKIHVVDPSPTGDAGADAALRSLRRFRRPPAAAAWCSRPRTGIYNAYLAQLAAAGAIRLERRQLLGLIPARWQISDTAREAQVRARPGVSGRRGVRRAGARDGPAGPAVSQDHKPPPAPPPTRDRHRRMDNRSCRHRRRGRPRRRGQRRRPACSAPLGARGEPRVYPRRGLRGRALGHPRRGVGGHSCGGVRGAFGPLRPRRRPRRRRPRRRPSLTLARGARAADLYDPFGFCP